MNRLVPSTEYSEHIVRAINRAHSRVYVLALVVQQNGDTNPIITALIRAAHRGVDVRVMADFSTYSYLGGHLKPLSIYHVLSRASTSMQNRFNSAGIDFSWLGMYQPFMFAGRTHGKWIVIDDSVYTFGGINLHHAFSKDNDFMFYFRNKSLADIICREHVFISQANNSEGAYLSSSYSHDLGHIYFDGGIPGDSLIYRRAVKLVESATHVIIVTQYCPAGSLASKLSNTQYQAYFNKPQTKDILTNTLIAFSQKLHRIDNSYRHSAYIHAKFMIVTDRTGNKTALTGSHNFISLGGMLGTREVALETTDSRIINQLEAYYSHYIA